VCAELKLDVSQPELAGRSMTALHRDWLTRDDTQARERVTVLNLRRSQDPRQNRIGRSPTLLAADTPEFGLISLYGIVVQPRAGKPWRDKPSAGGERRR
jgi:hypothetical protein